MKKLLVLLLALVLAVGLFAACAPTPETNPSTVPSEPSEPTVPPLGTGYEVITIAQALELCGEAGNITTDRYYIVGTVVEITNSNYGAMTIQDATGTISVYGTYSADGEQTYAELTEKAFKGDQVLLHCILQNYNGTKEVKNARLIDFRKAEVQINPADYTEMTIAAARDAAKGTKAKVTGVVAQITYANGKIPSGVMLVDNTGSIYVYDSDLAARVKVGNKITIGAEKTWWILDTEQGHAATFGYKGCNQLDSAVLISNDEKTDNAFDTGWITETTVKDILDTPVTEDITTKIFKVTALVKKAPGSGFVNYYINDLDGTTGTYVYTQCNGSDFGWIDAFDGKICTVYVTVLNAKSTNSGCVYRFLPVKIIDENFDVSTVNGAEYVVKYHGVGQFQNTYTGNPALELLTSVDSELLKFNGMTLSYASSDSSVISISATGGKTVMNCLKTGTAVITVTGTHNGKTYSEDVTIHVTINEEVKTYPTVADAIGKPVGETVTVKGIVGPSLVNKTGFYLIDETGVIAVQTTADVMATLKIGQEVVLEGVRHINTKGGTNYYGQTCLNNATVVVNNYGNHAYSTASFKGNISVVDFYNLDATQDFTTSVFTMKATVVVEENKNYTNIYLSDGSTKVRLYCSSANQYNWLKAYANQEVTVEIAACNWNDKTYYVGCVLAVVNADGTKVLNELNFQ